MISDIRGDFGAVTGTVDYDGKDLTKAKINATIDVKSISTRVDKRDEHLKTDEDRVAYLNAALDEAGDDPTTFQTTLKQATPAKAVLALIRPPRAASPDGAH